VHEESKFKFTVTRNDVFNESFEHISGSAELSQLRKGVVVRFKNEDGMVRFCGVLLAFTLLTLQGQGVTREWFRLVAREIINPNYALFKPTDEDKQLFVVNPASHVNPGSMLFVSDLK